MSASIDTYRAVNLGTATPRAIVHKLLGAGVRFLTEAEGALESGESPGEPLRKARMVVGGLMTALNFEAGEMAQNFLRLYLFVLDRIQATQAEGRDGGLGEARRVLEILQSGWEEIPADETAPATAGTVRPLGLDLRG
jgi:flagellin-specific chaperone FliS